MGTAIILLPRYQPVVLHFKNPVLGCVNEPDRTGFSVLRCVGKESCFRGFVDAAGIGIGSTVILSAAVLFWVFPQ